MILRKGLGGSVSILALLILLATGMRPAQAQVSGISYSVTPKASIVRMDNQAGVENGLFYGGQLGFGFGEFAELNGLYLRSTGLSTSLQELFPGSVVLPARSVTMQRYGGDLKVNIGSGALFPYLTVGGGVLNFDPDGLDQSEAIYFTSGVGLQYSLLDRYTIKVRVENMRYRYRLSALLSGEEIDDLGLSLRNFKTVQMSNYGVSAGVQVYLGGRSPGELTELDRALQDQISGGIRGISLQVEPFAGEIRFDESLGFRDTQRMTGVQAGVDLGAFVGLRGFYWAGMDEGSWTGFDDLRAYGGEVQLNFASVGRSLAPHVGLGGGVMDVRDGYVGNGVGQAEDRPFLMAGLGLKLPLGNAITLQGGARSLLMSDLDSDQVSTAGQVRSSVMYNVGISFGLGANSRTAGSLLDQELASTREEAANDRDRVAYEIAERDRILLHMAQRMDSLDQALTATQVRNQDELDALRKSSLAADSLKPAANYVTLPVPAEGELYVRYGKPGGVTLESYPSDVPTLMYDPATGTLLTTMATKHGQAASPEDQRAEMQAMIREMIRAELGLVTDTTIDAQTLEALEARIEAQLEAGIPPRTDTNTNALSLTPVGPIAVPVDTMTVPADTTMAMPVDTTMSVPVDTTMSVPADTTMTVPVDTTMTVPVDTTMAMPVDTTMTVPVDTMTVPVDTMTVPADTTMSVPIDTTRSVPLGAASIRESDGRSAYLGGPVPLVGLGLDDPLQVLVGIRLDLRNPFLPIRFMPEVVFNLGGGATVRSVNLNGALSVNPGFREHYSPYVGAGIGFAGEADGALALNLLVGMERITEYGALFSEVMTQNLLDHNRVVVGYRFSL